METTTETQNRRKALTSALLVKFHRVWHEARGLKPCSTLKCEHPWAP